MVRRSVADDSYGRAPFAWAIELREVHALPCAQSDRTVADREGHAVADEDRFDVRGAVSFGVVVLRVARDRSLERRKEVFLHIGVRVLVDEDRRGRVCDRDGHDPVPDLRACDRRLHARGDIDRLLTPLCFNGDRFVPSGHAVATRPGAPTPGHSASRSAVIRAMSAAVALPPLTTSTVRRPRGSTFPARTAASGAAPEGSTRSDSASRYSYEACSSSESLTVTNSSTYRLASSTLRASVLFATSLSATLCGCSSTIG